MTDKIAPERRSRNMQAIKAKDMKPELVVRRAAHRLCFRFRLHRKDLPGRPDLVFGPRRKIIFVHGCFWHQHTAAECLDGREPKSNTDYWHAKLQRNVDRDAVQQRQLRELGWDVLIIWECETKIQDALEDRIRSFLEPLHCVALTLQKRRGGPGGPP